MGDVAEVTGATDTLAHKRIEVEDVGVATLRFKSGALGVIEAGCLLPFAEGFPGQVGINALQCSHPPDDSPGKFGYGVAPC